MIASTAQMCVRGPTDTAHERSANITQFEQDFS